MKRSSVGAHLLGWDTLRDGAASGHFILSVSGRYASAAQFQFDEGEHFIMSRRVFPIFLAILALSAMSVSVRAKNDSGESITVSIKLTSTTSVGGTKLQPGDYKVIVDGNKAKFEKGNKSVAEVPCTVKDLSIKVNTTSFVLDHDQLAEIQVAGKSKAIDFAGQ